MANQPNETDPRLKESLLGHNQPAQYSQRQQQTRSRCTSFLKGLFICYNICLLTTGCVAVALGVWLWATDYAQHSVSPVVGKLPFQISTYVLVACGGGFALLAVCGVFGSIRGNKIILLIYGLSLVLVLVAVGVGYGLAFTFKGEISEHVEEQMRMTLTYDYGFENHSRVENARITEFWDLMQRQLQCCGISGNVTSRSSWSYYASSTKWFFRHKAARSRVPESCCAEGDIMLCTGLKNFNGPPLFFDSHLLEYREVNPYLYTTGCHDKLVEFVQSYSAVIGCVAAIIPLFLIVGIVLSIILCMRVTRVPSGATVEC